MLDCGRRRSSACSNVWTSQTYKTGIIISQDTYEFCNGEIEERILDFAVVKGRTEPITIHELLAAKGDISSLDQEFNRRFTEAVALYRLRRWDEALAIFSALAQKRPGDHPTSMFVERCRKFQKTPPPGDWNGVDIHSRRREDAKSA